MVNVTIDGIKVSVEDGSTILQAAEAAGVKIPTLCHIKGLDAEGSCRICLVEIEGNPKLVTACSTPVAEGNVVHTHTEKVVEERKFILDLLLSKHNLHCFSCPGNGQCKFQDLCYEYGVEQTSYVGENNAEDIDDSNPYFTYDPSICILCHRCVNTCAKIVGRGAISTVERGFQSMIANPFYKAWIDNAECEFCGNCVQACPTGALSTKNQKNYRAWEVTKVENTCYNCKNNRGCERYLLVKNGQIVDVQGKNDARLCNRGRFEFYDVEMPPQVMAIAAKEREEAQKELLQDLNVKPFVKKF